nr:translocation/assembly module TamB domain-containing protein [Croceivirga thetidis]
MFILLILVVATLVFSIPAVQTSIAKRVTSDLNGEFGTNIQMERIQISPLTMNTHIKSIYVEDYQGDTLIFIDKVSTSILSVKNLIDGKLEFGDFDIEGLLFNMKTYKGERDTNLDVFVDKLDDGKPREPGTPPFYMSSTEIKIKDGSYRLNDENLEEPKILDFRNLKVLANDFQILGPEVSLDIKELGFDFNRGLRMENLKTQFKYTKQEMRFENLGIKTPESNLEGQLVFSYDRKDFAQFLDAVKLKASFNDSKIAFNELNLFFNEFGKDKVAVFSGDFEGVLNDFEAQNLVLNSDYTRINGDFNFRNLFRETEPFIINADLNRVSSSYYQLRSILPRLLGRNIPSSLKNLGGFSVRGIAEITESSVDAQVDLTTAIGNATTDLQMTNVNNVDNASYRGLVSFEEFDIGVFLEDPTFGKTTLNLDVEGRGFTPEFLNTRATGEIDKLVYRGYEYNDIKVSGILKDQLFDGRLNCNDQNLRFDFQGLANFGGGRNQFNFIADVDYADLKKMRFINDSISIFRGNVKMDITGNTLDNIAGEVNFTDTAYQNKNEIYFFDDFNIVSKFEGDSIREISINSPDIIEGYARGIFKVNELGKLVQNSVGSIYTNYEPFEISSGQRINFNFNIYNKIVDVFFPDVSFGPDTSIKGRIVSNEKDFKLTFESPQIEAFRNKFDGVELQIDNNNPLFNTFLTVDEMSTIYYDVKDFSLINTTLKDTLFFRTEFKGGGDNDDEYNLNFYHTFSGNNSSVIGLKKSDVSFKGNTWLLNSEGNQQNKIIINNSLDSLRIQEIVMDNMNNERIRLNGQMADSTFKDLELEFKLVSLDKITPNIDSLKLDGQVDGFLNILQKDGKYLPSSSLRIDDFSVNKTILGDMEMMIFGNDDLTEYGVNTWLTYKGQEQFGMSGKIFDSKTETTLDLLATFEDFSLEPLAPLGEDVISNIRGFLSGSARVTGNARNPSIDGSLTMNEAGMGIAYLNTDYDFAPLSRVRLFDQTFFFENIELTDTKERTRAILDGTISHTDFSDWTLDLNVNADEGRFMILDTEFEEEALYYGTGFVNGQGKVYGPVNALNINFEGSTARGTSLKIPLSDLTSVGDYSFINFIEKNQSTTFEADRVLDEYEGVELFFDLDVTPEAEVEIVVDQQTGSSLKGTGEGLLLFEINTNGKFNMYGNFVVVSGQYRFKRAGVIDKTFTVQPGGQISWDGDPLAAQLDLEAIYSLTANPAPLLDSDNAQGVRRIPTDVIVRLDGQLESPTIDFDIDFPGTSSVLKSELEYRLQDPTIKSNNAFYLLAQGTFYGETTSINQQAVTGNLIQTASGLLNSVLAGDNDKFNFGLSYEQGYTEFDEDRVGVNISTQLSDRILVNGRVGVPVGGVSETVVAGDVEVQILLNEEGTLSAKIFNRENEIQRFLTEQIGYTQGVGLSYQVDFNNFRDLLRKIFKKNREVENPKEEEFISNTTMGQDSLIKFYSKKSSQKPK